MDRHEYNLYQLAENLGQSVTYLKTLPASELNGWYAFYAEQERRESAKKGNIFAMDDPIAALRDMGILDD
jgi:hypothetical protein